MNTLLSNEKNDFQKNIDNDLSSDILDDINKADEFLLNQKAFVNFENPSSTSSKDKKSREIIDLLKDITIEEDEKKNDYEDKKKSIAVKEKKILMKPNNKNEEKKEDSISFSSPEKQNEEEVPEKTNEIELESAFHCTQHLFHPIKFFCLNESQFLCETCKEDHLSHKENIKEYNEKSLFLEIEKMNNRLVQIKKIISDFQIQFKNLKPNTSGDNNIDDFKVTPNQIKPIFQSVYTFLTTPILAQTPVKLKRPPKPKPLVKEIFHESVLIRNLEEETFIFNLFQENISNYDVNLIYKASRDGFNSKRFHYFCDRKGPTLVVIKSSKGMVFGGYTSKSWKSKAKGEFQEDDKAFIFSLTKKTKHELHERFIDKATYMNENNGPVFGAGFDIFISEHCDKDRESFSNLGISYEIDDELSTNEGRQYLAEEFNFNVKEIEVFSIKY